MAYSALSLLFNTDCQWIFRNELCIFYRLSLFSKSNFNALIWKLIAPSAGAVEYADCISEEG